MNKQERRYDYEGCQTVESKSNSLKGRTSLRNRHSTCTPTNTYTIAVLLTLIQRPMETDTVSLCDFLATKLNYVAENKNSTSAQCLE